MAVPPPLPPGPRMLVSDLENLLTHRHRCQKTDHCTSHVCIWETPKGHGFMVPNPATIKVVLASAYDDLIAIVELLDAAPS